MNIKIKGIIYKWEVINQDGSVEISCDNQHNNLITDIGLDLIIPSSSDYNTAYKDCIKYFVIGTGTDLPLTTDTTLGNEFYRGECSCSSLDTITTSTTGSYPYTIIIQRGVETPIGVLNGNYTEIGFSNSSVTNDPLFSKFRLTNVDDDYVTVPISSTQQFRLIYQLIITINPNLPDYYTSDYGSYVAGWQNCNDIKKIFYLLTGVTPSGSINIGIRDTIWDWSQIGSNVSFNDNNYYNGEMTVEDYITGSHCRYYNISLGLYDVTFPMKTFNLYYNYNNEDNAMWIICFDTPLLKPNTHRTTLRFKVSWSN